MDAITITKLVIIIATFVIGTVIPFVIALVVAHKKRKAAKTEAERVAAEDDMKEALKGFIVEAEAAYKEYDAFMKGQQLTGGAVKKESVMTKALAYALEKGYEFNAEFIGKQIDNIVEMTRKVNAK